MVPLTGWSSALGAEPNEIYKVPQYANVAEDVGIHVFYPGEGLQTPPVEYVGGGVCWGDFDGDGYDDLFFTKSNLNNTILRAEHQPRSQIFRNEGDGTFTEMSEGSGASIESWGLGCSVADYDADGDLDIFYAGHSVSTLLRNDGPFRFTNVTDAAGVNMLGKCAPHECFSTGSAWADVNRDGCLDLYVVNYGNFSVDAPTSPTEWPGQANVYFENDCDGTFTDRTLERNLDDDPSANHSRSFMPMWCDFDADGLTDVYITADGAPNSLLKQKPDGTFVDVAIPAGVDDDRAGMGLEFDDVDGDGSCDLFMTHYSGQNNGFYVEGADGLFRDRSGEGNLSSDWLDIAWGTGFLDVNQDGLKDIYVVNGHTHFHPDYADMVRRLYLQNPSGTFRDVGDRAGPGFTTGSTGRGSAWSDYDFDGDADIVIENLNNQTADLLRAANVTGNWLLVQLSDPSSRNGFAVGAEVRVQPLGLARPQHRVNHAGASFLSQNSMNLHFGLGAATQADVLVRWPDGTTSEWTGVGANRLVRATKGAAALEEDTLSPSSVARAWPPATDGWHRESTEVTIDSHDRGVTRVSGVASQEWRHRGGEWRGYAGPIGLGDGVHDLEYRAADAVGNREPARWTRFRVDATPPTAAVAAEGPVVDGWHVPLPTVRIDAHDATSGVAFLEAREDGGAWRVVDDSFTLGPGDGERLVEARATDAAGHASAVASLALRVDATPPTTRLEVASGPSLRRGDVLEVTSATRLALVPDDGAGSGAARTEYRLDGGPWTLHDAPFGLTGGDREVLLEYRSVDAVGHVEAARAERLVLDDHRPPEVRAVSPVARRAYADEAAVADAGVLPPEALAVAEDLLEERRGLAVVAGRVLVAAEAGQDVSGVLWTRVLVDGVERARAWDDRVAWRWDTALERPGVRVVAFEASDGLGNVGRTTVRVLVLGAGLA